MEAVGRGPGAAVAEVAAREYNLRVIDIGELYLAKAKASLAGAQSELEQRRFDNVANRAYYACFQAAVAGLIWAGLRPAGWFSDLGSWLRSGTLRRRPHQSTETVCARLARCIEQYDAAAAQSGLPVR